IEHKAGGHQEPEPAKMAAAAAQEMLKPVESAPAVAPRQELDVETPQQKVRDAARHEFGELIGVRSRPLEWPKILLFVISKCAEMLPIASLFYLRHLEFWIMPLVAAICILLAFGVFRNTVAAIAAASISAGVLLPLIAGSPYRMELQVLAGIISQ